MSVPVLDPENGLWFCPDDGTALRLVHIEWHALTFECLECGHVWDAVPVDRVVA